jgi:hypothetical protein
MFGIASSIVYAGTLEVISVENIEKKDSHKVFMQQKQLKTEAYKKIQIKESGKIHTLKIQTSNSKKLTSKDGLILKFSTDSVAIEAFEKEFNLKFIKKLQIGYYIFENQSTWSDFELIDKILESDSALSIRTIRPNWKMDVKPI